MEFQAQNFSAPTGKSSDDGLRWISRSLAQIVPFVLGTLDPVVFGLLSLSSALTHIALLYSALFALSWLLGIWTTHLEMDGRIVDDGPWLGGGDGEMMF